MINLIPIIDKIIKFGLQSDLTISDKEKLLERNLVKIYDLYFEISYVFDETDYKDFEVQRQDIRKNIESNFNDFGFYKIILDINDIENLNDDGIGDAIDDLTDIIIDLLEIKWRIENNSLADGLWFFELTFHTHTQQHILDLLNYLKQKNG